MQKPLFKLLIIVAAVAALSFAAGCAKSPRDPASAMDTPAHHVSTGIKLLDAGQAQAAAREFEKALELDRKFAPAHTGLGLASAMQGDFAVAQNNLKAAEKYAKTDEHKAQVCVAQIRLHTLGKNQVAGKWLDKTGEWFDRAVRLTPMDDAPHYFMGIAYKEAFELDDASRAFIRAIDLGGAYTTRADAEYAKVQKVQRAMPGTAHGRRIAFLDSMTRADVAALFVSEMGLEKLFRDRTAKGFDTGFKPPETGIETERLVQAPKATDISGHVLEYDIRKVMELDIRGLGPHADRTFGPDIPINRAEFALMMEDLLIKLTGDAALATRFIGSVSPFPDVRSDLPFFNAIMVCTSRGIMQTKDIATGEFDPSGAVSGADALLSIRTLKGLL